MMLLAPRLSEKSYALSQKFHTYVFDVPSDANRQQIKAAVQEQFKVRVVSVRVLNRIGKVKKSVRKRSQPVFGIEKTTKRAFITLDSNDKLTLFEEV